jgi:hypothetical protein
VEIAIDESDAVLFMCEAATGITDYDAEIADLLRRSKKPVVLCVNKVDSGEKMYDAYEFYGLGLGEVWTISAANGSGTGDLLDRVAFDYDAATGTLQAPGQAIGICLNRARLLTLADVYYPVLTLIPDVAVTPAQPAIIEYVGTDDGLSYITLEVSDCGANGETLDPTS